MMMKKTTLVVVASMVAGMSIAAPITISDNFDGGTTGPWNTKWAAGTDQQNLWGSDAGSTYTVLDGLATSQYRMINQNAFTIDAGETATISTDFRYEYDGGGNVSVFNKSVFGFLLTTTDQWYNGVNKTSTLLNRGEALGTGLPNDPWTEGWVLQSDLGVDIDSATPVQSDWFNLTWNIREESGTLMGSLTVSNANVNWTSSDLDIGIAAGTTLYAGYTTGYQNTGTNLMTFAKMNEVNMDNFEVQVIPEPATIGLIGAAGAAMLFIRRRMSM